MSGYNYGLYRDTFSPKIKYRNTGGNRKSNKISNFAVNTSKTKPKLKVRINLGKKKSESFNIPGIGNIGGGGSTTKTKTRNEVYNEIINETIIDNAKTAVFSVSLEQLIDIQNSQNIILQNVNLKQVGQLNAKVVQDSLTSSTFANDVANRLMNAADVMKSSLSFSSGSKTDAVNITKNKTETVFKSKDFQTCAADANAKQTISIMNAKNVLILDSSMDQVLDLLVECIQKSGTTQEVLNSIFTESDLNTSVEETGIAEDIGKGVGTAAEGIGSGVGTAAQGIGSGVGTAAEGVGTGVGTAGQGIGSGVGTAGQGIGSGVGDAVGGALGGLTNPIGQGISDIGSSISSTLTNIAIIIAVLFIVLIIIVGIIFMVKYSGSSNTTQIPTEQNQS